MESFNRVLLCACIALTGCDNSIEFSGGSGYRRDADQAGTLASKTPIGPDVNGGLGSGTDEQNTRSVGTNGSTEGADGLLPTGQSSDSSSFDPSDYKEVIFNGAPEDPSNSSNTPNTGGGSDPNRGSFFTQEFNVDVTSVKRPVDLIFAVDTSGSMKEEKDKVAQNIQALTKTFAQLGNDLDYKMWFVGGDLEKNLLNTSKVTFVKTSVGSTNALNVLNNMFTGKIANSAPLREKAHKAIIVISDDNAREGVLDFKKTITENAMFKDKTSFFGFVWIDNVSKTTPTCTRANHGQVYIDLANAPATRGTIYDLCTPDWTILFQDLGTKIVTKTLVLEYPLSKVVDTRSPLSVYVDGSQIESNRYRYDGTKNSLIFNEGKAPAPGTKITVKYFPR
jgi:hypothetical protein